MVMYLYLCYVVSCSYVIFLVCEVVPSTLFQILHTRQILLLLAMWITSSLLLAVWITSADN